MQVTPSAIPEVLILEPKVFGDERGFFYESFNARAFREQVGVNQDSHRLFFRLPAFTGSFHLADNFIHTDFWHIG